MTPAAPEDPDAVARRYGEHLTDADLRALAGDRPDQVPALRRRPELVLDLLDRPAVADAVLAAGHAAGHDTAPTAGRDRPDRFRHVSPFLLFAAAVHRVAHALVGRTSVLDRAAPRSRLPVLDAPVLAAFAAEPAHRLFLAELLASYARSGPLLPARRHELDLPGMVAVLAEVGEAQRPGVWRRIGDGALFLAGVFPEYAERSLGGRDAVLLGRAAGRRDRTGHPGGPVTELLEELAGRAHARAGSVPPGIVASPRSARRVLALVADHHLFPRPV